MMKMKEIVKSRRLVSSIAAVALAVAIGITGTMYNPEISLPSYEDPEQTQEIILDDTALAAAPKVTTKTTTSSKTSKKNVKLSTAASKTYTKKLPTTSKTTTTTSTSKSSTATTTVKKQTTVQTSVTEKYTKKSKVKVVTTVAKTTIKTTTTVTPKATTTTTKTTTPSTTNTTTPTATTNKTTTTTTAKPTTITIAKAAPLVDSRVSKAWTSMGFTMSVDGTVAFSGRYDTKTRSIVLRKQDDTVYHELGHFVAWLAGNADTSSTFQSVFTAEKSKYTAVNKSYVLQNSSEYFAESFKEYTMNKAALKAARPKTYAQIEAAVKLITDQRVSLYYNTYKAFWK